MCQQRNTRELELIPEFEAMLNEYEYSGQDMEVRNRGVKLIPHPRFGYVLSYPKASKARELEMDFEVFGDDDRKPILDTTKPPYRWICRLELDFGGNIGIGTGTLISPRHILTAGHNLFDTGGAVTSINVCPGYNCGGKIGRPFGTHSVKRWDVHATWRSSLNDEFDYGLITLNSNVGDAKFKAINDEPLGHWGHKTLGAGTRMNAQRTDTLRDMSFNTAGYPGDKCCYVQVDGTRSRTLRLADCKTILGGARFKGNEVNFLGGAQQYSFGRITDASPAAAPRLITYTNDTYRGHSGSPLWIRWEQFQNLIAIHTGSMTIAGNRINKGVRITEDVLKQVRAWM